MIDAPERQRVAARPARHRMRCAVIAAPGRAELRDVPMPTPGPGQLLVRVEGSGVCGSNLPVFEGRPWFSYPFAPGAPGHEGYGRVADAGPGAEVRFQEGGRVAFLSGSAFAEFEVVDAASVLPIPPPLGDRPFPGEPLACGVNVFRRARIRSGDVVAVVGVGFLGAVVARLAAEAGARVLAIARRPYALALAGRLGAEPVAYDDGAAVAEEIRRRTGGALCDVAVEAVGLQGPLDLASSLVRERGRLVIAGFHQDGLRSVDLCAWNWRAIDIVNAHERDPAVLMDAMGVAAEHAAAGVLDLAELVTHAFPLERIGEAFEAMRARPDGFLKAVVTP
jgi:threonine dehydrogenase-like Zn-dependent dehydrogenase